MGYEFSIDDVAFLRSRHGRKALLTTAESTLTPEALLREMPDLRARYGDRAAALVEIVRTRRKAAGKLADAGELLAGDVALQQATASAVAEHRAADIARHRPDAVVHDVTCSIGAEVVALADTPGIAGVIGSDTDPVRLAMAEHNIGHRDRRAPWVVARADALVPTSTADVVIADPARRSARGRTFRLDELDPPLMELLTVYAGRELAVKCAPGLDYRLLRDRFGFAGQAQAVSLDGGVREVCLWSEITRPARRATVLRSRGDGYEVTSADPDEIEDPGVDDWIIDPDGAVVRAGLVRHYARRHGLRQLDPQIAYLTGDRVPSGERGFRVIDRFGTSERGLRTALAARDCGSLEILVRGIDVDPDRLRKRLKLSGSTPYALIITRIGRAGTAFLCEPGRRGGDA
ncbi:class I SAM-dependent methyltransferase [Gordonia shandongensis]|uniref:class I SAM-dependent methyltransferase n=1 Tax=Gordonia shandongensis TaxID=376351 RepID=UPI00041FDA56|nr:class I SAM-dependent methyltransferase [Gordonia shandongensis]